LDLNRGIRSKRKKAPGLKKKNLGYGQGPGTKGSKKVCRGKKPTGAPLFSSLAPKS